MREIYTVEICSFRSIINFVKIQPGLYHCVVHALRSFRREHGFRAVLFGSAVECVGRRMMIRACRQTKPQTPIVKVCPGRKGKAMTMQNRQSRNTNVKARKPQKHTETMKGLESKSRMWHGTTADEFTRTSGESRVMPPLGR